MCVCLSKKKKNPVSRQQLQTSSQWWPSTARSPVTAPWIRFDGDNPVKCAQTLTSTTDCCCLLVSHGAELAGYSLMSTVVDIMSLLQRGTTTDDKSVKFCPAAQRRDRSGHIGRGSRCLDRRGQVVLKWSVVWREERTLSLRGSRTIRAAGDGLESVIRHTRGGRSWGTRCKKSAALNWTLRGDSVFNTGVSYSVLTDCQVNQPELQEVTLYQLLLLSSLRLMLLTFYLFVFFNVKCPNKLWPDLKVHFYNFTSSTLKVQCVRFSWKGSIGGHFM